MIIPKAVKKEILDYPKKLLIYGQAKVGKTTMASKLPKNLIIDLEEGTEYVTGAYVIDVTKKAKEQNTSKINIVRQIYKELSEDNPFDFITFDTIDIIEEEIGKEIALAEGVESYTDIPYGGGYAKVRDKVMDLLISFSALANIIVIGHRKKNITGEEGKEVNIIDFDLTGKLKNYLFAWADAIGYMHRIKTDTGMETRISFKSDEIESLEGGSRIPRLANKTIKFEWEEIYPFLKESK